MSKPARSRDAPTSTHDQGEDHHGEQAHAAHPEAIPVGTYRDGKRLISASYDPVEDVVLVADPRMSAPRTVPRATWAASYHGDPIDRVARQRRDLLRAGELLEQPACGEPNCACRLAPCERARSDQVAGLDRPRCRRCLPEHIDGRPPWVHPEDCTVDRSVVATVQDRSD